MPQFLAIFPTGCLGIASVYGTFGTRECANESANGYGRDYARAYTKTVAVGTRLHVSLGTKKFVATGTSIPSVFYVVYILTVFYILGHDVR